MNGNTIPRDWSMGWRLFVDIQIVALWGVGGLAYEILRGGIVTARAELSN
jgi:hypothetical protein